jgi:nitrate reductase NapE component
MPNNLCRSSTNNNLITPQITCPSSDDDSSSSASSSSDPGWSVMFIIWPIVIISFFGLTSFAVWYFLRRRQRRVPRNWNPSARTSADDGELPSYAEHWRSSRPWWTSDTVSLTELECADPPPDYPECPKYPETAFAGEGRRQEEEEGGSEIESAQR